MSADDPPPDDATPDDDAPSDALPAATHVGRVALRVNDVERVAEFYESVVGLTVMSESPRGVTLGVAGTPLLELRGNPDAPERPAAAAGLFHVAFRFPSRAALSDALGRVERSGRLSGASDHLVSEALYLSDPEGNGVELYWDRPRDEWPTDDDGRVGMETLPLDLDDLRGLGDGARTAPEGTTVGHVHLEVSSLDDARAFYGDALGMRVRQTYGASALFLAAGDYHHHVGLNVWNGRTDPVSGRGLAWFELLVPDEATLAAARRRFEKQGVAVTAGGDTDAGENGPDDGSFAVVDPDGVELRVAVERTSSR